MQYTNEQKLDAPYRLFREVKLTYKKQKNHNYTFNKVVCSEDSHKFLRGYFPEDIDFREYFYVVYFDRRMKPVGYQQISAGTMSGSLVDTRMIFAGALLSGAQSVVLAHNHPTGYMQPSQADIKMTQKLKKAGEALDIKVLDHLILSGVMEDEYFSFADNSYL